MYIVIHRPSSTPKTPNNKNSCGALIKYLSKEINQNDNNGEQFFSHENDFVNPISVQNKIDNNHRTLKKNADKFYMLTINPSQRELAHLIEKVTGKKVKDFNELTPQEQQNVLKEFKIYARQCMNRYAQNFRREKIKDGNDIVYFGKIEKERHYKSSDEDVKEGRAKSGELKPGLQLHIHIVVSRMDKTQTVSLSPLANSKGSINKLNGKKVITGFEYQEWSALCNDDFIKMYDYDAQYDIDGKRTSYVPGANEAMSAAKSMVLQNEFRTERTMLNVAMQLSKFIYNPKAHLQSNIRHIAKDIIKGK